MRVGAKSKTQETMCNSGREHNNNLQDSELRRVHKKTIRSRTATFGNQEETKREGIVDASKRN